MNSDGTYDLIHVHNLGVRSLECVFEGIEVGDDVFGFGAAAEEVEDGLGGVVVRFCCQVTSVNTSTSKCSV